MNTAIGWVLKWSGFGWIWDKINGYKTKIGGGALLLSGLAQVLTEIASAKDMAGIIELLKYLPQDRGVMAVAAGLGMLGLGHKMEKATGNEKVVEKKEN